MKKSIFLILTGIFLLVSTFGQSINKTPVKSESWKEFVAEDNSFKILFPNPPKEDVLNKFTIGGILEGKESKRYLASSGNEKYFIGFKDFPAPMLNEAERRAKYESMFLFSPDREVYVQKHPGVEKSEEARDVWEIFGTYTVNAVYRVFIIEQRLFILGVFVPKTNEPSTNKHNSYQAKIDKFFNSFTVMEIPPAKYSPTRLLPEDFGLTLEGQNFQSGKLNLSLQIPAGWKAEIDQPKKTAGSESQSDNYVIEHFLLESGEIDRKKLLFARSSKKLSEFWLTVERRDFADTTLKEVIEQKAALIALEITKQVINGREFQMTELKFKIDRSKLFTIRRYYTDWRGFILEIGMGFEDEADKRIMEESLKTLKVLKQQ